MTPASAARCPLCGGPAAPSLTAPDLEYDAAPGPFTLFACPACPLVFLDPLPGPAEVAAFYPPTYYTRNPASPLYLRGAVYRAKLRGDARRLRRLLARHAGMSLLDVGCGDAARLFALRAQGEAGLALAGIDLAVAPELAARAAAASIRLVRGDVETDLAALEGARFDLVLASQVIEHLREPHEALRRLRTVLAPGGRVLLETPNLGGLDHRLFGRRHWGGYHVPRHLRLFDRRSLQSLLERAGYVVEEQGALPSPGFWIISLRNALGLSSARRSRHWAERWLHFANLPVVGAFTAFDLARTALGLPTSNQYALARPAG